MAGASQLPDQLRNAWAGLSAKQKLMLAFGAVLTIVVLFVFINLMSKPDYKPLFTGMEPSDAQALAQRLAAKNIPYEVSPDGRSVNVPSDKIDTSRIEVASEGMPRSGRLGFELFDKMNWGQTEFDEKVNYQRALEGELERTIATLHDVESARVHLVLPADSVFIDRDRAAKASVVLKLKNGRLSEETQASITHLVSGAVDKLSPENVTVVDADTNRPLGTPKHGLGGSDISLEQELTAKLMVTLAPVVGVDHVRGSVTVEADSSTTEENQESFDPESRTAVTTQISEERNAAAASAGVPGTSSNVPNVTAAAKATTVQGGDGGAYSKTENTSYVVDKVVRHIVQPAGRVKRLTAAVVVDDAEDVTRADGKVQTHRRKRTPEELKQLEELAKAAIGIDSSRGDSVVVQNLSFQEVPADAPLAPSSVQRVRIFLNDWSAIVRYAALLLLFLLVYGLLLRPIKKQAMRALEQSAPGASSEKPALESRSRADLEGIPDLELLKLPEERQRAMAMRKRVIERVKGEPVATSRLVQSWLREGE